MNVQFLKLEVMYKTLYKRRIAHFLRQREYLRALKLLAEALLIQDNEQFNSTSGIFSH